MGTGYLKVQALTGDNVVPVRGTHVTLMDTDKKPLYETYTDMNGNTEPLALPAPDKKYTLDPTYTQPAYSVWNVDIQAKGFVTLHITGVEIVDTQTSILPVQMEPLPDEPNPVTDSYIDIPPIALLDTSENRQVGPPAATGRTASYSNISSAPHLNSAENSRLDSPAISGRTISDVIIPDYITVHLGAPTNSAVRNVRVKFIDYIKNVASDELCQGGFSR